MSAESTVKRGAESQEQAETTSWVVEIPVREETLVGTVTAYNGAEDSAQRVPGALLLPGYKSERDKNFPDDLTNAMAQACKGVILKTDLLGQGDSSGELEEFSLHDQRVAALAARDYMIKECNVDPKRWGVMGTSLGGTVAALLKEQTDNLFIQGLSDFQRRMLFIPRGSYMYPIFRKWREDSDYETWRKDPSEIEMGLAMAEIIKNPKGVTIVESTRDEMVPRGLARLAMSFAETGVYHFLDAGHTMHTPQEKADFQKLAVDWARSL